ncbi:DUF1810 domain-containing protein [Pseudomonas sp. R5(2019)]|uniref:DUF1810 domain-containing protein n=1 Tax=Pseudomonas sp. R5(2019) TaxID=2697566 RepID=UPI001411B49C|nr:DUF1810 domain-containing protein [Pseudomonas sp. R5(2019)]NBA98472.1 DUF1810 family protein [Pseudomonas sp. R5(2019)]
MHDPFNLLRFVEAQRPVFTRVMEELRAGRKTSHWMWFIFPQLEGLGHSEIAERFAISGAAEARAYLQHEVLGPRLEESVAAILQHSDKSALQILGRTDDLKLRSCLTLFASIKPDHPLFQRALDQFYGGEPDARTLALLGQ